MRAAAVAPLLFMLALAQPQHFLLHNPNANRTYTSELVRLPFALSSLSSTSLCLQDGSGPVPFQLELLQGTAASIQSANLWVAASLAPGASTAYTLDPSRACPAPPPSPSATLSQGSPPGTYLLSTGTVSLALPSQSSTAYPPPAPLAGFSLSGSPSPSDLAGSSAWNLTAPLAAAFTGFTSTVLATGPLYVEVALNYTFGRASFASWRVRLAIAQPGAVVTEEHVGLSVDAAVDIALHSGPGWAGEGGGPPTLALGSGYAYCDPSTPDNPAGMNASSALSVLPLAPIARLSSGSLGYMLPRWTQACDARFYWGVAPGSAAGSATLGAMAVRSSEWLWPQYRSQSYETMRWHLFGPWSSGPGTGFLHLPLYGRRVWVALAGPIESTALVAPQLAAQLAGSELERLTNTYDLSWPGGASPPNATYNAGSYVFYSDSTDPTHTVRQQGRALLQSLQGGLATAPPPTLATLAAANTYCDPDWWGSYVGFSSPENPNFFTDWSKLCLGWSLAVALRGHPRAGDYCALARGVWEADLQHSITLPSGAGQESPGYTAHAMTSWVVEAPLLDAICPNASAPARKHPRLLASVDFLLRTSQPWAYHFLGPAAANNSDLLGGRFVLPLGDTHPTSTNFTLLTQGLPVPSVQGQFGSAELPGFGALLQARAGLPGESFLALKASPNRGHNHGDQLSIHYAAYGARMVIDIMAGYLPRPYQEFWHNRLCFGRLQNLDGYERLLGWAAGPQHPPPPGGAAPAAALGQVTSSRLLSQPARPPQNYLQVFPTQPLAAPLTYRRTALLVPALPALGGAARDYVVLVDAHNGSALGVPAYSTLTFFQQQGMVANALPAGAVGAGGLGLDMGNGTVYAFAADAQGVGVDVAAALDRWDWPSEGNENATRLSVAAAVSPGTTPTALFVTLLYPDGSSMGAVGGGGGGGGSLPSAVAYSASTGTLTLSYPGGHRDVLLFSGLVLNATEEAVAGGGAAGQALVTLVRDGAQPQVLLSAGDVDGERGQGDVGLDVLDAGYTFGEIPEWVVRQKVADVTQPPPSYPWPLGKVPRQ